MQAFVEEASEADRAINRGGEVYAADDVHPWLERLRELRFPALSRLQVVGVEPDVDLEVLEQVADVETLFSSLRE